MVLRDVQLTGVAPEGRNQTQYEFKLFEDYKSEPKQVCLAVETSRD